MAIDEADGLVLRGQVQRGYTLPATPQECYEYLSDIRTLLSQVPYVTKIQVGKTTGRARAFFNFQILAIGIDAVLDIEPVYDPAQRVIRIKNTVEPLGETPPGYFNGSFNSVIRVVPAERNGARVTSQIVLAFDGNQLLERGLFSRYLLETSGPSLLQQYCERLCDDYVLNLLDNFRKWQGRRQV